MYFWYCIFNVYMNIQTKLVFFYILIIVMEQAEELEYQIYKDYEIINKIGKGTYGVVYKAQHKKNKKIVAIKKIIDAFQNLIDAKRTYRQLNYLLQLEHPTIVRLEYILSKTRKGGPNQPSTTRLAPPPHQLRGCNTDKLAEPLNNLERHVYAVFEYVETDLRQALKRCSQLQAIQRKFIGYQLLHGIAYLHRSGLIHRDIKPQNLLLNCNKLELKICDFGMTRLKASLNGNQGVLTQYVASRWYRPPQALLGISTCQPAIDLWSVGCVLAQLALKTPLFAGKSTLDQLQCIFKAIGMPTTAQIQKLQSQQSRYVLKNFSFSRKAKMRPLQDLLSMCCNTQIDLIMGLLNFDPNERTSAEKALKHQYFDEVRGISQQLEAYANSKAHITDMSERTINEKGQKVSLAIEDYRKMVEELQKLGEKTTNRSGMIRAGPFKEVYNALSQQDSEKEVDIKSTKQSNFVTEHKHHFLAKTQQQLFKKKQEPKHVSTKIIPSKGGSKNNRSSSKNSLSKAKHTSSHNSLHIENKNTITKPKIQRQFLRIKSKNDPIKKVSKKDKDIQSKDPIQFFKPKTNKVDHQISKNVKRSSEPFLNQYKSASKMTDNASIISNISKISSNRSKSKDRSVSKQRNSSKLLALTSKEELIKKVAKQPLNLNKSGLMKCKSVKHGQHFKR